MKYWTAALCMSALLLSVRPASTTTVIPPSFDELVSTAEVIFIGEVVDQRSMWETTPDGRSIITVVTFDVTRVLKGRLGLRTELTFLGGTVGDLTEQVVDMPQFRVGDQDVLFVSSERYAASPLVGFSHGRFRIETDPTTRQRVVRSHDGKPLIIGLDASKPLGRNLGARGPLQVEEFEAAVRERARRPK